MSSSEIYDLIIIGAGAAGLFAAANAPPDSNVLVLEKMDKAGRKLLLSGSGQCNLTNNEPIKDFIKRYGANGKVLRRVLYKFSNAALIDYFEKCGLPIKVREDNKVFPKSMKSGDVLRFFMNQAEKSGVKFCFNTNVVEILYYKQKQNIENNKDNKFHDVKYSIKTNRNTYLAKNLLVATGGKSFKQTGSDGTILSSLSKLGLKLIPCKPALVPLYIKNYPFSELSGLTFLDCTIKSSSNCCPPKESFRGSMLLTHKGFSGPTILKLSRYLKKGDSLTINFLPTYSTDDLRMKLIKTSNGEVKQIISILSLITQLPRSFIECICQKCEIKSSERASHLAGKKMGEIAKALTEATFEISECGDYSIAMSTSGGVSLNEINLGTMEAKHHPGLYFAGEVLDVDGDTGGYNLQFAFSSAMCAMRALTSNL